MNLILAYKVNHNGHTLTNFIGGTTDSQDLKEILDWLISSHTTVSPSCYKVIWNLSDLARLILSKLPKTIQGQLSNPPHQARWENYRLFYVADKVLSINKNGLEADFYDLSQYFPGQPEPAYLSLVQEKADLLQTALKDLGVTSPRGLSSPLGLFKGHPALNAVNDTPTVFDLSETFLDVSEMALQCTPREWVSNYQIGNFPELWGYDQASAYPANAAQLIDLRDCVLRRATEVDDAAYYGFLTGDFTVYPNHPLAFCSPFLADRGDGTLVNFVGTKKDHECSLEEVRILYRYEMGEFKFKSGWLISPSNGVHPRQPLKEVMEQLYRMRGNENGGGTELTDLKSYLVKRVMNGIVGQMLESRKDSRGNVLEYGAHYNPIYHAIITSETRLQVFEFIVQNEITREELVHVGVDGIKAIKLLTRIPLNASLGRWRRSEEGPAVMLSPGGVLTTTRRYKSTDYAELFTETTVHANSRKFGENKKDPIDLGKLFLNQTRIFDKLPRNGRELMTEGPYLSRPTELT